VRSLRGKSARLMAWAARQGCALVNSCRSMKGRLCFRGLADAVGGVSRANRLTEAR